MQYRSLDIVMKARGVLMSTSERKIGFYNFIFEQYRTQDHYFDMDLFRGLWDYIFALPPDQRIIRNDKYNKAISIDSFTIDQVGIKFIIKVVFKSCKYNHSPEYMSSIDGAERQSDKQLHEGEKEKTHLCIKIMPQEAAVILEERRSGVTINNINDYLNKNLKQYLEELDQSKNFKVIFGTVPSEEFLEILRKMPRVRTADIYTHKRLIGSEALGLIEREDTSMKEEICISLQAKSKGSLGKYNLQRAFESMVGESSEISRIRIYGLDQDYLPVKLDTAAMKKMEYVTANLNNNGIVDTSSIFVQMMQVLGVY